MAEKVKAILAKDAVVGKVYTTLKGAEVTVLKKNQLGQALVSYVTKTKKSERAEKKLLKGNTALRVAA